MQFDPRSGWCQGISHCPSPNFNARPEGEGTVRQTLVFLSQPAGTAATG